MSTLEVRGRLVLDTSVVMGRIRIEDDRISGVDLDEDPEQPAAAPAGGAESGDRALALIAPGLVDVHVHGWGGHDAMGSTDALDGVTANQKRAHQQKPHERHPGGFDG